MLILIIIPSNKTCLLTYAVLSVLLEPCVKSAYCLEGYMLILIIIPSNKTCQLTYAVLSFRLEPSVLVLHIVLILVC